MDSTVTVEGPSAAFRMTTIWPSVIESVQRSNSVSPSPGVRKTSARTAPVARRQEDAHTPWAHPAGDPNQDALANVRRGPGVERDRVSPLLRNGRDGQRAASRRKRLNVVRRRRLEIDNPWQWSSAKSLNLGMGGDGTIMRPAPGTTAELRPLHFRRSSDKTLCYPITQNFLKNSQRLGSL